MQNVLVRMLTDDEYKHDGQSTMRLPAGHIAEVPYAAAKAFCKERQEPTAECVEIKVIPLPADKSGKASGKAE